MSLPQCSALCCVSDVARDCASLRSDAERISASLLCCNARRSIIPIPRELTIRNVHKDRGGNGLLTNVENNIPPKDRNIKATFLMIVDGPTSAAPAPKQPHLIRRPRANTETIHAVKMPSNPNMIANMTGRTCGVLKSSPLARHKAPTSGATPRLHRQFHPLPGCSAPVPADAAFRSVR